MIRADCQWMVGHLGHRPSELHNAGAKSSFHDGLDLFLEAQ